MAKASKHPTAGRPEPLPAGARSVVVARGFSGPLPSPEVLAAYKEIDPTLVGRIVDLAEVALTRQADDERAALNAAIADRRAYRMQVRFGQCFAFGVSVIGLFGSVFATVHNFPITGGVLGGGTLVSLTGIFLYTGSTASHRPASVRPTLAEEPATTE